MEENVGAAFVGLLHGEGVQQKKERMQGKSLVFQAEIWAFSIATCWLSSVNEPEMKSFIYVDILDARIAISNSYPSSLLVQDTEGKLGSLKIDIRLKWVQTNVCTTGY